VKYLAYEADISNIGRGRKEISGNRNQSAIYKAGDFARERLKAASLINAALVRNDAKIIVPLRSASAAARGA